MPEGGRDAMKAAVLHGPCDLRVSDVAEPCGEVLVSIDAATTCGTDVKMWRYGHRILPPYPCAFGHEMAGVRVDTGERVLVSDSVACGSCACCGLGRPQICRDVRWVFGGFAELMAVPRATLHVVPDGLPAAAAAMAEPLAAAVHAVARGVAAVDAGDVGVLGGGPMGLMLAGLLVASGRNVTLADRHPERRAQAAELGARAVATLGSFDLVFEAVGRPEAWDSALRSVAAGGTVVMVGGCPSGSSVTLPPAPIHYDEVDVLGAFHHSRAEVDEALALLGSRAFDWRVLEGETIGLDDLASALAAPSGGAARKWVVVPR
jgi:L-iditol 2-dehydrogenase